MYRYCFSVLAGLLATAAFTLTPSTALAQHRGGRGGGHAVNTWRGGNNWRGSNWRGGNVGWRGSNWNRGWGNRGWGWGGVGIGLGLGYPYYGYGGYYGSYSPGFYTYSTPYYYGDSGVYDTTPYYYDYGTPTYDYNSTPAYSDMTNPAYSYGSTAPAQDNEARIKVMVPQDAKVWFNGHLTKETGTVRDFDSPALAPGKDFTYDVKAQWRDQNGKEVTRTRQVNVRANSNVTVDFNNQ
jgi:uncharacterized protein (TIGR03000 family)